MKIKNAVNSSPSISHVAALIPARRHEPALSPLIDALLDAGFGAVLVVDDGSPPNDGEAFDALARKDRVRLLRHAANLGKGQALKTGIRHFLNVDSGFAGLVTLDADGQHLAADALRVANALLASPDRAVFGCRSFERGTPLRNGFGNALTSVIFHWMSGCRISDTQTGLRAFPTALLPELAALPGDRYEYEMRVLAHLCRRGSQPLEVPITTIYIDSNRASSFDPIRDSMRIYFVLLRCCASSLASAVSFRVQQAFALPRRGER